MPEVIIAGAGPAGLTLAIELARRDVDFLLVDRAPGPFAGSRGKAIQPDTFGVLEDLGVLDEMVKAGGDFPPQRVYSGAGAVDRAISGPLLLPQFRTEAILRDRLGGTPLYDHELLDLTATEGGVTARIGGETVHASYLVGCDGGASTVRKALGIGFPGRSLGIRAFVADVRASGLSTDAWHLWHEGDRNRQTGLCPLAGTDLFQCQGALPGKKDPDLSAPGLTALLRDRTGDQGVEVSAVPWASAFEMSARLADRFRHGRVFLAGDAAHVHPPLGGQGLNTSIQDAYNLGWKLAAALRGAPGAVLDSYEAERRPIAQSVLGLSTRLLAEADRRGTHRLDLSYPDSPLNGPGALAGHRVPAALLPLTRGSGPRWTLLADSAPPARPGIHVVPVDRSLTPARYVLVRPDRYVALITDDAGVLDTYLDTFGGDDS